MFEQFDTLKCLEDTPIPEYIPIYHAIDWMTEKIDRPYRMDLHSSVAEILNNSDDSDPFSFDDHSYNREAKAKEVIQALILTGKMGLYYKKFESTYNTRSEGIVIDLGKPDYRLNMSSFSPDNDTAETDVPIYTENWQKFITPKNFRFIEEMREHRDFAQTCLDGYILSTSSFSDGYQIDADDYKQYGALLYLKTSDIKRHVIKNHDVEDIKSEEKRGRKPIYSSLETLIAYLVKNKVNLSILEGEKQESFAAHFKGLDLGSKRTLDGHLKEIQEYLKKYK